ncbi:MAG: IS3 family transposase [Gammaproteobacteria bacterium]|nr:MAG: IS3 family transposase [Gammaproteobacteria bacterium]
MARTRKYKRYSAEFKREALKRASEDGTTDKQVCEELGISPRQLARWRDEFRLLNIDAFSGRQGERYDEIIKLKKELAQVKQERDFLKQGGGIFCQGVEMRYQCIERHRSHYPVRMMCQALQVSRSGYYAWRTRPESQRTKTDRLLMPKIQQIHQQSKGVYGAPRIRAELKAVGHHHGRHKITRLMRLAGLRGCPQRRFKVTTQSDPSHPVAKNLIQQDFTAKRANQRWAADITYIATQQGWLYLAIVMDLYSRRIVGWSMDRWMGRHLVIDALKMALGRRDPDNQLIHHSDRGAQYTSDDFRDELDKHGIQCSMSAKGNCYDNAVVESFFGVLKRERVNRVRYRTRDDACADIFDYIECFYNRKRRHSYLGYISPAEYENRTLGLN